MRSLKLKVEELSVESFAVDAAPSAAGTVRGHESDEEATGYVTCNGSCHTCPTGLGPNCCVAEA